MGLSPPRSCYAAFPHVVQCGKCVGARGDIRAPVGAFEWQITRMAGRPVRKANGRSGTRQDGAGPKPGRNTSHTAANWKRVLTGLLRGASRGGPELELRIDPHNTEMQMNKNQIEGSIKKATGKIEQKVGEITGNTNQQVKGAVKQLEGNVQKGVGNVEQAARTSAKRTDAKS